MRLAKRSAKKSTGHCMIGGEVHGRVDGRHSSKRHSSKRRKRYLGIVIDHRHIDKTCDNEARMPQKSTSPQSWSPGSVKKVANLQFHVVASAY